MLTKEAIRSSFTSVDYWMYNSPERERQMPALQTKVRLHQLKYEIVNGIHSECDKRIVALAKTKDPELDRKEMNWGLTPLHLAVHMGELDIVVKLLDAGASPEVEDSFGWTPVHTAALIANNIFIKLLQRGVSVSSKTRMGATVSDIRALAGYAPKIRFPKSIFYQDRAGAKRPFEVDALPGHLNLSCYSDELVIPKNEWPNLWVQKPLRDDQAASNPASQSIEAVYRETLSSCPEILIAPDPDGIVSKERGSAYGLFAGEEFKEGRPFLEFVGNASRIMNCGFPGLALIEHSTRGLNNRRFFVTVQDGGIPNGKGLYWDHGPDYAFKWGCYRTPNKEEMWAYFKGKRLKDLANKIGSSINNDNWIDRAGEESKMVYLLTTPEAVLDLICAKIINGDDFINAYRSIKKEPFFERLENSFIDTMTRVDQYNMDVIRPFSELLKVLKPVRAKTLCEFISNQLGRIEISQIVQIINLSIERFNKKCTVDIGELKKLIPQTRADQKI